ncbi:MAG: DEAD/DEAH box helicase family protein [Pseudomonadota bacterium]
MTRSTEHDPTPRDPRAARILAAAERLFDGDERADGPLRADQHEVFEAFADYLGELACGLEDRRWAHIVLPPRTGKTVLAARIVEATGLHAAFVVPTRVLVEQVAAELARFAPKVPTGAFFSDRKDLVPQGLNLVTYASLTQHGPDLPEVLRGADLVFVDEAHHALSAKRRNALARCFAPDAIRVALTATPDYDESRRLDAVFPRAIARVELRDALEAGLLAPAHVHVAEVDVDGSRVEIVAGEYRADQIGELLGQAPFLEAALRYRYAEAQRARPCMIACSTRRQATALRRFFQQRRPAGSPAPALLLGETPAEARGRALCAFERGRIDTLVQVGVLVEGWSSPRCKLLIDLAPGRSRVRATQKYFRVLTRHGTEHAHIVVILPRHLARPPVLPLDLLLEPGETYRCGQVVGASRTSPPGPELPPVRSVRLVQRLLVSARLGLPTLARNDLRGLLAVLSSCEDLVLDPFPGRMGFERLFFSHPLFSGTGRALLRWLGVSLRAGAYDAWVARLFPEQAARAWLGAGWNLPELPRPPSWLLPVPQDPEARLLERERDRRLAELLAALPPREREALQRHFGLSGDPPESYQRIGERLDVSLSRAGQIALQGLHRMIDSMLEDPDWDDAPWRWDRMPLRWYAARRAGPLDPVLQRALRERGLGQAGIARVRLEAHVSRPPGRENGYAQAELATLLERAGQRERAAEHWALAIEHSPGPQCLHIARSLHAAGRYHLALAALDKGDGPGWWQADCRIRCGDPASAARQLDQAWRWSVEDRYHHFLARHLTGMPAGGVLLWAVSLAPELGRRIARLGEPIGTDVPGSYLAMTGDLWTASEGARERVACWVDAAPVASLRQVGNRDDLFGRWSYLPESKRRRFEERFRAVVAALEALDPWTPRGED